MAETTVPKMGEEELLRMTADVVAAYVSNNTLPTAQLAEVINAVYGSLKGLESQRIAGAAAGTGETGGANPQVDHRGLFDLPRRRQKAEDAEAASTLDLQYLTPDEYRARWGLAPDYPMVAPNYAEQRSAFAKKIGLGRGAARVSATAGAKK